MVGNHIKIVFIVETISKLENAVRKAAQLQRDYPDAQVSVSVMEEEKKPEIDLRAEAEACFWDYISGNATLNQVRERMGLPRLNSPGVDDLMGLVKND